MIKNPTFLRDFWMNSPVSSWNEVVEVTREWPCDKRGCGDTVVPLCLIPTPPALHPSVTDVAHSWIVLTGSQFWCSHLKQVHFCCCYCCCEDSFCVQLSSPRAEGWLWSSCRWEHRTRAAEFTFF